MSSRGVAPIIGVVGMLAVVTVLGGVVAAVVPGSLDDDSAEIVSIELDVNAENNKLTFHHQAGQTLTVSSLDLRIYVDSDPIPDQPNLAGGMQTGIFGWPQGAFNPSVQTWSPGEVTHFKLAADNGGDAITLGTKVTVEFHLDGQLIASTSARAS